MVVVRGKGLCVFDSTAPHEYFPTRTGDEIVDLYAAAVAPGTDERYAAQLSLMAKRYKALTGRATAQLGQVRESAAALDAEMRGQLDAERVAVTVEQLLHTLFQK